MCGFLVRVSPHADETLAVTAELLEVFTTLKIQDEIQMQGIRTVAITTGTDTEWVVHLKWAGW